ncbi:MAG: methionyl-tRNA formyltransferase [Myxococcales bacterium]|nr:methionyl-tRNA formyltransferase [Myxococcales bacterium]MCB9627763.1 methionyl-tRNA formyltransferase [Sandaracinaceae bacterium]
MSRPRAVFFGSPDFAVPSLVALTEVADVVAVIAQPDKPAGRGLALRPPAVKERALELGLPVLQPRKVRDGELARQLRELAPDVAVVIAYGRILPLDVLTAPRLGCVNLHGSLLPRWRGAAPIQWAVASGDPVTGVTLMQMDEGLDTGPMLGTLSTPIGAEETSGELFERLAGLSAQLLRRDLPRYVRGELEPVPQDHTQATHARPLDKADGRLDWTRSAAALAHHVRGMSPWPGAFTMDQEVPVKVHRAHALTLDAGGAAPGTVLGGDRDGVRVACGQGVLSIQELQQPGRKRLSAEAFLAGRGWPAGTRLG